jgi:hypothetical protein
MKIQRTRRCGRATPPVYNDDVKSKVVGLIGVGATD